MNTWERMRSKYIAELRKVTHIKRDLLDVLRDECILYDLTPYFVDGRVWFDEPNLHLIIEIY